MIELIVIVFFCLYLIALGIIIGVGFVRQRSKERWYEGQETKVRADEITVLVPFRNEAHRIRPLLDCINALEKAPAKFIFIDDHSDDATDTIIHEVLNTADYVILKSPEGQHGKKKALRYGAKQVDTEYTLTIDADVVFEPDFFTSLEQLGAADMYVLPAIMKAESTLQHFYEIDLVLVTAANAGLAGLSRPIMASGANLLYKTTAFEKVDNVDSHIHMASGDDTYLLRDFRENKTDVRLYTGKQCAISTETPQSFREFVDQRLRWIGKTGDIKDHLSTTLAVIQAVLTIAFFALLITSVVLQDWEMTVVLFGLKALSDLFLFFPYFKRIGRVKTWLFVPVYEVLFPLYTIVLIVLLLTYKPKWKGRAIYEKKN